MHALHGMESIEQWSLRRTRQANQSRISGTTTTRGTDDPDPLASGHAVLYPTPVVIRQRRCQPDRTNLLDNGRRC